MTIVGWVLMGMGIVTSIIVQVITAVESPAYWTHMELRFLSITISVIGVSLVLACLREDKKIPVKYKAVRTK